MLVDADKEEALKWLRESERAVFNNFVKAKYGDVIEVIESQAAEIARLKEDAERYTTLVGMLFQQSLHFRMVGNTAQLCNNSMVLGEGAGANAAIDSAKGKS